MLAGSRCSLIKDGVLVNALVSESIPRSGVLI
jgi:hypothetical protein